MPAWPGTLPAPLIADYTAQDVPVIIKTTMASGPQRRTRVSGHYMTKGTASIYVTKTQADTFRSLVASSKQGADWITSMPLDTGQGLAYHRARIESIRWSTANLIPGTNWRITFGFETDERNAP